jgi:hypothetical protein
MGTEVSASNEWIELFNDGDVPVDLAAWTLKAKDESPSIVLSGTISPKAYFLIERTDDDTVPNISADLVTSFGKGLSNEGETLELRDASGTLVDMVVGGKEWKNLGGDLKTKLTPQKQGGIWVTAKATPRSATLPPPPPVLAPVSQPPRLSVKSNTSSLSTVKTKTFVVSSAVITATPSAKEHISGETSALPLERIYGEDPSATSETPRSATALPLLGTLLLLGSSAIVYFRVRSKTEAEKYEIIEDESEETA